MRLERSMLLVKRVLAEWRARGAAATRSASRERRRLGHLHDRERVRGRARAARPQGTRLGGGDRGRSGDDGRPSTVRPSITLAAIVDRVQSQKLTSALVTHSDGTLVGLVRRTDAEAALSAASSEPSP